MAKFSRTWWGERFISALEQFTWESRLQRGRTYARGSKVKSFSVKKNIITAKVEGSINPYFGVYEKPTYSVSIHIKAISAKDWSSVISQIGKRAGWISKLLMGQVPENIEDAFIKQKLHLLPHEVQDFKTSCSCPDFANPCKHIAGAYYLVAAELDEDPFLLFELRGLSREALRQELQKTSLGKVLSSSLEEKTSKVILPRETYFTEPFTQPIPAEVDLQSFWKGKSPLPALEEPVTNNLPALLVKKQGDYPAFWNRDNSFLETMEELYIRLRKKNKW